MSRIGIDRGKNIEKLAQCRASNGAKKHPVQSQVMHNEVSASSKFNLHFGEKMFHLCKILIRQLAHCLIHITQFKALSNFVQISHALPIKIQPVGELLTAPIMA